MKKIIFFAMIFLLLITFAKAESVKIMAKTEPFHNIILRIQNPMTGSEIISLYGKTNVSGTVVWDYDANINKLDFLLIARLFGETVLTEEFDDITVKPLITLSTLNETEIIVPAPSEQTISDDTLIDSVDTSESTNLTEDEKESTKITGFSISEKTKDISKKGIYILVLVLISGSLFFIFKKVRTKKDEQTTFNDEINDIVSKLHEAEREIKNLRNKNLILEQAQRNFMQAKDKWERTMGYSRTRINTPQRTERSNQDSTQNQMPSQNSQPNRETNNQRNNDINSNSGTNKFGQ